MMRRLSHRTVTLTASALSALVLAFPARGYAGHYDNDDWNSSAWQGVQHEREELDQARDNQREDWRRLQHERREMDEARQAGNWGAYQHERRSCRRGTPSDPGCHSCPDFRPAAARSSPSSTRACRRLAEMATGPPYRSSSRSR